MDEDARPQVARTVVHPSQDEAARLDALLEVEVQQREDDGRYHDADPGIPVLLKQSALDGSPADGFLNQWCHHAG